MKKIVTVFLLLIIGVQGFYIYYLKDTSPKVALAHGSVMVIERFIELEDRIKEKGSDQAVRELIMIQAREEIRLKKLIEKESLTLPESAKQVLKESITFKENA
jgi:dephospho-CoA kinase